VGLLRASAEGGLLAGRLEAVRLQDTLEGLGRRALAGATATGGHCTRASLGGGHCRRRRVASRSHFI